MSRVLSPGYGVVVAPPGSVGFAAREEVQVNSWRSNNGPGAAVELALTAQTAERGQSTLPMGNRTSGTNNQPQCGYFRLVYGCGANARQRFVDMQAARLYLGVCDQVDVYAGRWKGSAWPDYTSYSLFASAALAEAEGGAYDELVATEPAYIGNAAAISESWQAPEGAHSFAVRASGNGFWGSANPDIVFATQDESFVVRPSQYTWVPPFRRSAGIGDGDITLSAAAVSASALYCTVSWYLNS